MSHLSQKERDALPDKAFAFPTERKEPLVDANHVRSALARQQRGNPQHRR